ncbi:MAG TPA: hypothetical protein VG965_07395, partial [Patescibacteria group bacterium]|nr:hypothetical protein [Patescibacteria group bacterium]
MGLLLFDIDGTMFDPQVFGRLLRAEFAKILGTSEKDLWRVNSEYYAQLEKSTDLDPRELVAHVASSYGAERAPLDQVFWENDEIYKKSF